MLKLKLASAANYGPHWPDLVRIWNYFGKEVRKRNWSSKVDFSAKVAYLTTCPEYEYGIFISAGTLGNLKVVKLWKRVYLIWFLVQFEVWSRSELWDVESNLTIGSTWRHCFWPFHMFDWDRLVLNAYNNGEKKSLLRSFMFSASFCVRLFLPSSFFE